MDTDTHSTLTPSQLPTAIHRGPHLNFFWRTGVFCRPRTNNLRDLNSNPKTMGVIHILLLCITASHTLCDTVSFLRYNAHPIGDQGSFAASISSKSFIIRIHIHIFIIRRIQNAPALSPPSTIVTAICTSWPLPGKRMRRGAQTSPSKVKSLVVKVAVLCLSPCQT